MTEVTLHPAPRTRDVVLEQLRIVGLSLRREALVVAGVIAMITLVMAADIARGNADTWFDSEDWAAFAVIAFVYPFAVWRREKRFGPGFLWTLPVDRRRLALARVFAGWVWLTSALAAFVCWQLALIPFAGVAHPRTVSLIAFPGTTAVYLFGSALLLGLRHPLRLMLGAGSLFFLLAMLDRSMGRYSIDAFLDSGTIRSAADAASTGPAILLWIIAALVALWAAVLRHGEHRRR